MEVWLLALILVGASVALLAVLRICSRRRRRDRTAPAVPASDERDEESHLPRIRYARQTAASGNAVQQQQQQQSSSRQPSQQASGSKLKSKNIEAAKLHAAEGGLKIDYRHGTAEALAEKGERFDAVLALEIIEHVADPPLFVRSIDEMVKPGGLVIFSTLNRTAKSYALAIVGAEYVLGWLPRGTHDHRKFVKPSELARFCREAGLEITDLTGMVFSPLSGWSLNAKDLDVNYFACAERTE